MQPQNPTQSAQTPQTPADGSYVAQNQPSPEAANKTPHNPLEAMRPGEEVICEIKRHPIGMMGAYVGTGILLLTILVVGFGVAPMVLTDYSKGQIYGVSRLVFLILGILSGAVTYVSHIVYWGNRWVVTDDSVTQISQISLFSKQSSQLSMGNIEDVTAEQNGIVAHMFNYGLLKVETAGERSKFVFTYLSKSKLLRPVHLAGSRSLRARRWL